jgi:hypothetical protein
VTSGGRASEGSGARRSPRLIAIAAAGAVTAFVPARLLWGFTVDDALIPARYAAHLARGLGYRFNAAGAITDGVTPLGFPYLFAPFAREGPLAALTAAKIAGVCAWTLAAAVLALAIDRAAAARARFLAMLLVACSAPLAAWSVAGLETGIAAALGALAVALPELGFAIAGSLAAGLVAALRPEALPFALALAMAALPSACAPRPRALRLALAGAPFVAVALARLAIFGRVVPLSVLAKPSDLGHGLAYAGACFALAGPVAIVAPLAWRRLAWWPRSLIFAVFVHFAAVASAGGDWMPLSRLVVPALPAVVLAAAHVAAVARPWATAARLALALAGELFAFVKLGPDAARVGGERARVIEALRAPLAEAKVVAALDIGWLGAATDATIVDLAGLTDPAIAPLPGGHTSKQIPRNLLDSRKVDTIVLRLMEGRSVATPWNESYFASLVELRLSEIAGVGEEFQVVATSDIPHLHYVVVRRVSPR